VTKTIKGFLDFPFCFWLNPVAMLTMKQQRMENDFSMVCLFMMVMFIFSM